MDSQKQQAVERIKQANNILVTVSASPSVDQLAACIGLTIALNKMGKHATAVFSGNVPSTLEFLQPEKTIEKNTDSLRDFIIALDKSKADKLRYKVEDRVVKIFITPYRTSISDKDLEFSQGDFNVDVVLALGVHNQAELDQAITSHGRILHDATIVTVNLKPGGELGTINWLEPSASSLSELGVRLIDGLDKKLVDTQVATALLTGIVAETERFSNAKTSPQTMSISAELMAAGANQQLVATKLEEPVAPPPPPPVPIAAQEGNNKVAEVKKENDDGTLEIAHDEPLKEPSIGLPEEPAEPAAEKEPAPEKPEPEVRREEEPEQKPVPEPEPEPEKEPEPPVEEQKPAPQIRIDEHGALIPAETTDEDYLPPVKHEEPTISHHNEPPKMILEPPTLGGQLTASATPGTFGENEGPGLPGLPEHDSVMPDSMKENNIEVPSVGPTITPPSEKKEEDNVPGTSFLGDQPITAGSEEKKSEEPDASKPVPAAGETLSDIERDVHSSHLAPLAPAPEPETPQSGTNPLDSLPQLDSLINPAPAAPAGAATGPMLPPVPSYPADTISEPVAPAMPAVPPEPVQPTSPSSPAPIYPPLDDDATLPATDQPSAAPADGDETANVDNARDAVTQALNGISSSTNEPIQALNAQPLPFNNSSVASDPLPPGISTNPASAQPDTGLTLPPTDMPASDFNIMPPNPAPTPGQNQLPADDPNAPPPVPPPMMPPMQ
jgi:hypothetical protein